MKTPTKLNQKERELIAAWRNEGISNKEIARRLNRHTSTIGREVKHNDCGQNENANLWIRYYFPKGTDFNEVSEEEIKDVEGELNNRPRKRLNFKTAL